MTPWERGIELARAAMPAAPTVGHRPTTSAEQLLRTLEVRGVRLTVTADGRLHTSSNPSCLKHGVWGDGSPAPPCGCLAITPILAEGIRRHHDELVDLINGSSDASS